MHILSCVEVRRFCVIAVFLVSGTVLIAQPGQPNYEVLGWATVDGMTTGGTGGMEVTASTGEEILQYIKDKRQGTINGPLTILVDGAITPENTISDNKIAIKDVNDVSLIGVQRRGVFVGIGVKVTRASNIIIRNITVFKVLTGDKDAIGIEGPADHIWVDHCELYAEYQGVDKDYYDGLLDVKRDAEYITYSWNYFHDSWKTMLAGSSESDTFDRKLTIHHNLFENCNSRMPLFRGGNAHIFNNYYVDIVSTAINSRIGACVKIENNFFQSVLNPYVSAYSDVLGAGEVSGNILEDCSFMYAADTHPLPECTALVPYDYADALQDASVIPDLVPMYAGVNKLDLQSSAARVPPETLALQVYPTPTKSLINVEIGSSQHSDIKMVLYDSAGMPRLHRHLTAMGGVTTIDLNDVPLGIYFLAVQADGMVGTAKVIRL